MTAISEWGWAISLGAHAVVGWVVWSARRAFADRTETETRLSRIESRMEVMPSHSDLQAIAESMAAVRVDVAALTEAVNGLKRGIDRLQDHHLHTEREGRG